MQEWNRAIELIETDLAAPIAIDRLAKVALTSEYHFRRMFASLAGIPVTEYIRRRRLTVATAEILAGQTVLEVAIRYGYGSAEAFTRAFKVLHGLTPSQARRPGAVLHSQPQLRFHLHIEGSSDMKHSIVNKEAFGLVGFKTRIPLIHKGPNPAIEEFERKFGPAEVHQLAAMSDIEPTGTLALTDNIVEQRTEGSELDYWHAVATSQPAPEGFNYLHVPVGYGSYSRLKGSSLRHCNIYGPMPPPSGFPPIRTAGHQVLSCSASRPIQMQRKAADNYGSPSNGGESFCS